MAKKRTSLDSILPPSGPAPEGEGNTPPAAEESEPVQAAKKTAKRKKQLALLLDPPVYQQLRTIAFEEETKMHPLMLEGLDRVFADRGLPSINDLTGADDS